jgi:hypothetical protein
MKSLLAATYFASLLFAAENLRAATPTFLIDVANREQARAFFNGVYAASSDSELGWTGSVANCNPGTISADAIERIRLRLNYFRAMAGVSSSIEFDPVYNAQCQAAALMFSKNGGLSHEPPPGWDCFTAAGAAAAANSDISYGAFGSAAVDGFIYDPGAENFAVGHRRWLLFPQTKKMGVGTIPEDGIFRSASAIWVIDGTFLAPRPDVRDTFVSWPPPGFTPHKVTPVRWSLSFPRADFNSATVVVSTNGVSIPLVKEAVVDGYAENTLVWRFSSFGVNFKTEWPKPAGDTTYHVKIANVGGLGVPSTFEYNVTVFDAATTGPDTVATVIGGPDTVPTLVGGTFTLPANPMATGYDLRVTPLQPATEIEGAENFLVNFTTNTTKLYPAVVSPGNTGARGFRLCHAGSPNQSITFNDTFIADAGAEIRFASKLTRATITEFAKVQVSTDLGATWNDVYSQAGVGFTAADASFVPRTASLANFANRPLRVRFAFTSNGATFDSSVDNVGWYFDDIAFVNCSRQLAPTITPLTTAANFNFTPPTPGRYTMEARPKVWDAFALDYGPLKLITANTGGGGSSSTIASNVTLTATNLQFTFNITAPALPVVLVYKANSALGPWTPDLSATIDVITPGSQYRAKIPTNSVPATFYRAGFIL